MQRKVDQWNTALAVLVIVGTLLACKKRTSATAPAAESAAAAPLTAPTTPATPVTPPADAVAAADPSAPKLGEVKRYPDKEKAQTGAVRILADEVKVFNEADDKTADVATLTKDLLVFRLASVPDYELVEFPSGVGKVSPGWVLAKFVDVKTDAKVERAAVAAQSAVVTPATKSGASATAKPTGAAASAKAAADKAAADKAAADKAAADKAAADKAAAAKAAADKAAADKAAADLAVARAERAARRAAERAKKAAEAAAAAK